MKEDNNMERQYTMDQLTVEDILKYAAQGNDIVINDGHVIAIVPEGRENA